MHNRNVSKSLTSRLVLIVVVSLVGLAAASVVVLRARRESDAVREETASGQARSLAQRLREKRDAIVAQGPSEMTWDDGLTHELSARARSLLSALTDASAGYCLPSGELVVRETVARFEQSPPLPGQAPLPDQHGFGGNIHEKDGLGLLPLDREVVVAACRAHTLGASGAPIRFVAPNDVLFLSVMGGHEPFAAWALVRIPKRIRAIGTATSPTLIVVIALSTLAVVGLCIDTVLKLRAGIGTLASALTAVQSDLTTTFPHPSTKELASIAAGLRAMATHIQEARDRELTLERNLAHERRLASLGRVAAGVAHEVRNPLAGIKLRLDSMARRGLDERTARDVQRSLSEVARLDAVVGSLLYVARKEPAPQTDVDLASLVDERLAALDAFASTRTVYTERVGEARARVDPVGIARVVDNLVRNSIEVSPQGEVVRVELSAEDNDVFMRVIDRGPGVPNAHEGKLFEPFSTTKPDGTGLGLSLSHAAVKAHGGTLTYSRYGGATSFTIWLPGRALA